ncbi:MAG: 30S ribosomal protein S4 [Candidatus Bathyarchaeia archaeon]
MGDPKRQRRKYETPRYPWSKPQLDSELRLLGEYGLRNKRELRRHYATLSKYRSLARELLGMPADERGKLEKEMLLKLQSYSVVPEGANIDNVLDLTVEDILARRLQTIVFRKGLANTPRQARQLITHGHVTIRGRKVRSPSYLVKRDEEMEIGSSIKVVAPKGKNVNQPQLREVTV